MPRSEPVAGWRRLDPHDYDILDFGPSDCGFEIGMPTGVVWWLAEEVIVEVHHAAE